MFTPLTVAEIVALCTAVGDVAQREVAKAFARPFGLRDGEGRLFDHLWKIFKDARDFEKDHAGDLTRNYVDAFIRLGAVVSGTPVDVIGFRHVTRQALHSKAVVFSDLHMTHRGHRHDFFLHVRQSRPLLRGSGSVRGGGLDARRERRCGGARRRRAHRG